MTSQKILIVVPGDDPPQLQGSAHLDRLRPFGEVALYTDRPASDDEKVRRAQGATILINSRGAVKWPGQLLRRLPGLRMISTCGIGSDAIDLAAARDLGIVVSNIPGQTAALVAEHALALMLAVARRLAFHTDALKHGRWLYKDSVFLGGKTLGIVGAGSIGAQTARLARAIGMNVIAWTFHPTEERARQLGLTLVSLEELLGTADVVSIHVMLTEQSRGLIGARELSLMKPAALLINTARGAIVDTAALVSALNTGRLAGAGIDCYDLEPIPPDHALLACEHVVLTPHNADQTPEGTELLNAGAVDNVIAFLEGKPRNRLV